ncbi:hypothetical protein B0H67DRAFT_563001 [Lasiosphaeris hirsuta]|uniref:Uncharacterized protein n=1 Tax=Lasiosphaeris hirsuta TaxID=260670 RepID=A0AA40ECZ5_9PEZI|nr:hypothetical protein B0H67DRAFT_563001 [Lasiosphaeris hirsuta]
MMVLVGHNAQNSSLTGQQYVSVSDTCHSIPAYHYMGKEGSTISITFRLCSAPQNTHHHEHQEYRSATLNTPNRA